MIRSRLRRVRTLFAMLLKRAAKDRRPRMKQVCGSIPILVSMGRLIRIAALQRLKSIRLSLRADIPFLRITMIGLK